MLRSARRDVRAGRAEILIAFTRQGRLKAWAGRWRPPFRAAAVKFSTARTKFPAAAGLSNASIRKARCSRWSGRNLDRVHAPRKAESLGRPLASTIPSGGGQVLNGPHQVPGGSWIIQCFDPQGAMFALVGPKS